MRVLGRRWWAGGAARALLLLLLLLAASALLPVVSLHSRADLEFPQHAPQELAHALADFSNHPKLDPEIGSWSVEEEARNSTCWRYTVSYTCGARCTGLATLWHTTGEADGGARAGPPRHDAADAHRLRVLDRRCTHLPLLRWAWFCDETEVETRITRRAGGGSVLRESARGACGAAGALAGRCGLRARRACFLRELRGML